MYVRKGHILESFGVAAVVLGLCFVFSIVLDVDRYGESRLLFAPGKRIWVTGPVWALVSVLYALAVWWACFRRDGETTWLTGVGAKLGFSVTMLCFCSPVWSAVAAVAHGVAIVTATTPAELHGVVQTSGSHLPYRGTRQGMAKVRLADGSEIVLVDYDDLYTRHGRDVLLPNGTCDLARLDPGTALTLRGRTSAVGFVVDSITTPGECKPR